MIPTPARNLRHRLGSYLVAVPGGFMFEPDQMRAGRWTQDNAEKLLPMLPAFGVQPEHLTIVAAPSCGCCGAYRPADLIYDEGGDDGEGAWRCDRHLARVPCCITGCGRTFALERTEGYGTTVMCGAHWRMAPKRLRDLCSLVRRRAKRRGWTDKLSGQHHRFWHHARRAIERRGDVGGEGHIDIAEIERMFGL